MKFKGIQFVPVQSTETVVFNSSLDKQRFFDTHESFEFVLDKSGNFAKLRKFICVDTEYEGFVINCHALTYRECMRVINLYL